MRHVLSLVAGVVAAPAIWVLVALGQGAPRHGGWLLLGVGALAGLVATLRTSPLGPMFAGAAFAGASALMYLHHDRAMVVFTTSWKFREYTVDMATPLTSGVLAFAGGLLLMSVFSVSRWRSRSSAEEEAVDTWSPIPATAPATQWPSRYAAPDPDAWATAAPPEETPQWSSPYDNDSWRSAPAEETYGYR